jgi:GNAT superfamily N-acetyltransferase
VADRLLAPVALTRDHDVSDFDSGEPELDAWLREYAWVDHVSGNARVFVAARGEKVVGFYAIAMAGVEQEDVPDALKKGGVPLQVPCLLLARLAVDRSEHNRGLGRGLLVDAIRRTVRLSGDVGVRALLIHAKDDAARSFYCHLGEFADSPTDPLHLFLSIKQARKLTNRQPG